MNLEIRFFLKKILFISFAFAVFFCFFSSLLFCSIGKLKPILQCYILNWLQVASTCICPFANTSLNKHSSFIPDEMCSFILDLSSHNQFLEVLVAPERWECGSSDTQPSPNESIKWLPPRNCCIFRCLWEYLPSLFAFFRCTRSPPTLGRLSFWLMLSVCGSVRWLQSGEMTVPSCRRPKVGISLPLVKILMLDFQWLDSSEEYNSTNSTPVYSLLWKKKSVTLRPEQV